MKKIGIALLSLASIIWLYLAATFPDNSINASETGFIIGYYAIPILMVMFGGLSLMAGMIEENKQYKRQQPDKQKENEGEKIESESYKSKNIEKTDFEPAVKQGMQINESQKWILILASISVFLMILFPPTCYYTYDLIGDKATVFSGYRFIGILESNTQVTQIPPVLNDEVRVTASVYRIETKRLTFQLIGLLLATLFLVVSFHNKDYYEQEGAS